MKLIQVIFGVRVRVNVEIWELSKKQHSNHEAGDDVAVDCRNKEMPDAENCLRYTQ